MSDRQFAEYANTDGASRALYSRAPVERTSGYAVSHPGTERTYDAMTANDAAEHRVQLMYHPAALTRPQDAIHGAWHDKGRAYSDLSFVYNDRRAAADAMRQGRQLAMYDFRNRRSIYSDPQSFSVAGSREMGFDDLPRMTTLWPSAY